MRYVLLVYADESLLAAFATPDAIESVGALRRELSARDRLSTIGGLASVDSATTVRTRDGVVLLTDGPYAETRERLVAFAIAAFGSPDEALVHAARIPAAAIGAVEVRRVLETACRP